ncbi:metal ABC transporter substrate-binding protein [Thermosipho sp. (in: thermotogales)]|jgi:zinc transport system substrate-binding protein|uniref:metal ABC transporter substrate-binding protein n=1 Tax=Thermosipho sp. (in: thermotogales) TaxID=1968895 RepID=UPI002579715B|nr:metal ABC transporter substrate-binding protein [Thermosipho sp. (in: thermotogales)]MBZ4650379.1 putative periplasmic metal-binding protein [Thermosipho sp. (in: thermotogales)]MDK2839879.1 zinc transport system substrate-binding protein [Thermosipho sp. (in: thermotogales)]MDK2900541.1 zinc transport system substrate-binding protein [Thermosipho sp. (in: thermotogales)]
MKNKILITIFFILISSLSFSLIVTTINPYYLIVKQIVGEKDEVYLLLSPNVNPHTYSLRVSDVKILSKANIIFANGGIEPDLSKFYVVYLRDYIPSLFVEYNNPHFWLDPYFVKFYIIPTIVEKLSKVYPQYRSDFEANAKILLGEIDEFLRDYKALNLSGTVLVHHPSFYYFFKELNLKVKWVEQGHNVSVGMKKLIETIKSENIIAIFSEVQQSKDEIKIISKQLNKKYYTLDPLGVNAKKFIDIYYQNFEEIRKALNDDK